MRGTPADSERAVDVPGIIPAYAGNTPRFRWCRKARRDHPRVCGEHRRRTRLAITLSGSSPRMRGTLSGALPSIQGHGIIPAYAGNTRSRTRFTHRRWDHPRVCGEHHQAPRVLARNSGSSPRMRGTQGAALDQVIYEGIIPAYAGNTQELPYRGFVRRDHPRVCGEH